MGMSEREHHTKVLENLLSHYKFRKECEECEGYYDSTLKDIIEALQYAISSLKTDLKYDLMYEGEEIYTKSDVVAMLIELQSKVNAIPINKYNSEPFRLGQATAYDKCEDLIYREINKLKENI